MRHLKTAATLAVGLIIGASAAAIATSPPQQYTGCLSKEGLILRVAIGTAPAQACNKNETVISWNSQGPQGEPGLNGEPGPKGDQGEPGGVDSLDALDGTPCNVGAPGEGILRVYYGIENDPHLVCDASAVFPLTISFTGETAGYVRIWGVAPDAVECTTNDDPCTYEVPYGTSVGIEADGLDGARAGLTWTEGPLVGVDSTMWWDLIVHEPITMVGYFTPSEG